MQGKDALRTVCLLIFSSTMLSAQFAPDVVLLRNWPAPLYWQPNVAEDYASRARINTSSESRALTSAADVTTQATTPVGALAFVAMTPCRVVDTRTGFGFSGAFGPPSLVGGGPARTFPIPTSPMPCQIPAGAQAYSFNVTVIPSGATFPGNVNTPGALNFLTIWPTGVTQPNVSTLNAWLGTVVANAAIVPAGTNGSVDVFVSNNTDLIIDINGYYATQTGITLAQGSPGAPSLSFSNDSGTGIFSSGTGILSIATGGTSRVSVGSNGNVDMVATGNTGLRVQTNTPGGTVASFGSNGAFNVDAPFIGGGRFTVLENGKTGIGINNPTFKLQVIDPSNTGLRVQTNTTGGTVASFGGAGAFNIDANGVDGGRLAVLENGNTGIGTPTPSDRLHVNGTGTVRARVTSDFAGSPGVSFSQSNGIVNQNNWSIASAVSSNIGQLQFFNDLHNQLAMWLSINDSSLTLEHDLHVNGIPYLTALGSAGSTTLCRNSSMQVSTCSSSIRYKNDVRSFTPGLNLISRLRPVSFSWKQDGKPDMGLVAEEVADVEPLLVTHNGDGTVEGVKYDRVGVVLINAVQEQQQQIVEQKRENESLQEQVTKQNEVITKQKNELDALKSFICSQNAAAPFCGY